MTEKRYKLERWTDTSLYYSFPTGNVHQGIGYVIEKVEKDLNELADENEQLKQANQELTQKKNDLKDLLVNSETVLEQKKLQKIIYKMVIDLIDEKIEKVDTVSAEALKDLKRQLEEILND